MGNLLNLPNISMDSIVLENNDGKTAKRSTFNDKNYLNTRLGKDEKEKTLTIRLLPMDLETGNPFVLIHTHNVKVPQSMVKPGERPYKTYICLKKTKDIDHEKYGTKCPFCEINASAYNQSLKETDPVLIKNYRDISLANKTKDTVICRCIERGKEDEGVKFWKFNIRMDKADPYNQIVKLANLRAANAAKKGVTENILDIYNGRDLNVTITAGDTAVPTIVDDSDRSPLSADEEQMRKWIFDEKKWQDVFTCKPYEYLSLVSQMKTPWFDNKEGVWVDKEEYDAKYGKSKQDADAEVEKAQENVAAMEDTIANNATVPTDNLSSGVSFGTVDDIDLPF